MSQILPNLKTPAELKSLTKAELTQLAEELRQPPDHPYHTAGGTDVDLAIQDEQRRHTFATMSWYILPHPLHWLTRTNPQRSTTACGQALISLAYEPTQR